MAKHQYIKEDDKAFYMHDGKKPFMVAKGAIGSDLHEMIRNMPKYAQGGIVEAGEESPWYQKPARELDKFGNALLNFGHDEYLASKEEKNSVDQAKSPAPASVTEPIVDQTASQASAIELPTTAAPTPVAQPQAMSPLAELNAAGREYKSALQKDAETQAKIGADEAAIQEQIYNPAALKAKQEEEAMWNQRMKELDAQSEQLSQASLNNKIDPNRVWKNMGTGNKILAAISLVLGGAASGGKSDNNAALNVLNAAIDRDIKAQMDDKNNANTLYAHNLQKYRDAATAAQATRVQIQAIVHGMGANIANKYQGEAAKVKAQQLGALWTKETADAKVKLAELEQAQRVKTGNSIEARIAALPKNLQEPAYKEVGEYKKLQGALSEIDRTIDGFSDVSTIDRLNPFTPDQVAQKTSALVGVVKPLLGESMQEADVKRMVEPFTPGILSNNQAARDRAKRELKNQVLSRVGGRTPILTENGIIPNPSKISFTPRK